MTMRLKQNYEKACGELKLAKANLAEAKTTGDRKKATTSLTHAEKEVKEYEPKAIDKSAQQDREKDTVSSLQKVLQPAELGDKAAPFTMYGKTYNNNQLYAMYQRVGWYALGLPAFGPNILRTIHVTTVMTLCYQLEISLDDQRIKDHFALARHGEYEMRRSYNLTKSENTPFDPNCFSHKVAGIISAHGMLNRSEKNNSEEAAQEAALKECLGDDLFDGRKPLKRESSVGKMMREFLKAMMQSRGVATPDIALDPETIELEKVHRKEKLKVETLRFKEESMEIEHRLGLGAVASCKSVSNVDESQEIGRKRGHSAGAGVSCKGDRCTEKANQPKQKRARRNTFTAEVMPLLMRMNAIFKEKVVGMGLDPSKPYPRESVENGMYNVKTFTALCTERVKTYLTAEVGENDPDYSDVTKFYDLFGSAKNVSDVVKAAKKQGRAGEWSDWLCRKCKKVTCKCNNQAEECIVSRRVGGVVRCDVRRPFLHVSLSLCVVARMG